MPIFLLIRHGETAFNKKKYLPGRLPDVHLTRKGRRQAQALAEVLAYAPIKAVYASPLERTLETAEPLARKLKLEVTPLAGLLETDSGEWQGQSIRKLRRQKVWQAVQQHPTLFRFPGGESIADCQHRMVGVLESLTAQHAAFELVACFSHSDPIKQVVAYYLGLPLDNFQRLSIDLGSISVLQVGESGSRLITLNYIPGFNLAAFQVPEQGKAHPVSKG
jgi:probable phosphomutase (TIGR03848 family)